MAEVSKKIKRGIIFLLFFPLSLFSQTIDMDAVHAAEDFRWGVQAYHQGLFNKAILSFEKSLSYKPNNSATQIWLGMAYYRSGLDDSALGLWEGILSRDKGTPWLQQRVVLLKDKQGLRKELAESSRYVMIGEIQGTLNKQVLFSRPSSVYPLEDGSFYLVSFAGNEILHFSANGELINKILGGFSGLNHPFDIIQAEGFLFITEYRGNRVVKCRLNGAVVSRFGKKGLKEGEFVGPQFLAKDNQGYLYVTDYGNQRVAKYDVNGNFILSFGKKIGNFPGLSTPSGITVLKDRVYVADTKKKVVFVFDLSGNYLSSLGNGLLNSPEGMSGYGESSLLISDTNRVVLYDLESDQLSLVSDFGGKVGRIVKTAQDANRNLLAVDFDHNQVFVLSGMDSIYAGLDVEIEKIRSDKYPTIELDINVQDFMGRPLVGLESLNFLVTENKYRVNLKNFLLSVDKSKSVDIAILIRRFPAMVKMSSALKQAATDLYGGLKGEGFIRVISGSDKAVEELGASRDREAIVQAVLGNNRATSRWHFDQGLRLSASELIGERSLPGRNKKAVIFITDGNLGSEPFSTYHLLDLTRYLKNNHTAFYAVYLQPGSSSEYLDYLCRETGGESFYLYRPHGIGELIDHLRARKLGSYVLQYTSQQPTDFGKNYMAVEAEAYYYKKSGRDESGYFAPLEF